MKIILSRKGFDSGYGKIASPILPDGTLLSMPIPTTDKTTYDSLSYKGKKYSEIISELWEGHKNKFDGPTCHLDPDLRKDVIERDDDWCPAFGQSDSALTHLYNQGVKEGDVFLFFGWFKQTEYHNGKLRFVKGSPNLHIIYGYLQVGDIKKKEETKQIYWHPHATYEGKKNELNAIFLPTKNLLNTKFSGSGVFKYNKDLVLTKEGVKDNRSRWKLPECLVGKHISYHTEDSYKDGYFQSVAKGQEFVVDADDDIIEWVKSLTHYIDKRNSEN